jgi:hypothetical protein
MHTAQRSTRHALSLPRLHQQQSLE